jgi:subtilase family serine protease
MTLFRRVCALGLTAALASAGVVVAALSEQAAGGATTVPGTAPLLVQGGTALGAAPSAPASVTLALALRNQGALKGELAALYNPSSPQYHQFLTPAEFAAQYAPTQATVNAVSAWAAGAGLAVASVSSNRTLVRLVGTTTSVGKAFGTSFETFRMPSGQTYVSNAGTATLPPSLGGAVASVVGLSSLDQASLDPVVAAAPSLNYPSSYGPQGFWQLYNAPAAQTGSGQTVAVLAEGDLTSPHADLTTFENTYGLPHVPWTTVTVDGASTDTSGNDEWDLDTQYSTGLAPEVSSLVVYDGRSLNDSDILDEVNAWVTQDVAPQADFSAGECEVLAQEAGFQTANDQALEQAVAQGQTLFTAAGDTGAFCPAVVGVNGVPAGLPNVNYPAASPYAVGAGGTTVVGGAAPPTELAWYAGGGGLSLFESEPSWQAGVGGSNTGVQRAVPDVAFDSDPESGFNVVVGGTLTVVGGTSGASPSWLGIWARAQGAHGATLGFAAPTVYAEPSGSFYDVELGDNGIYPATPGYDMVTGRGTPNITAFVNGA